MDPDQTFAAGEGQCDLSLHFRCRSFQDIITDDKTDDFLL